MSSSTGEFSGYDAVVVGAGPAGISAAISVANRKKKVVVLDGRQPFAKARRAPSIPNYPGFQFASGEELATAFQDHLARFDVPVVREKVSKILRDEEGLSVFTQTEMYRTRTVILATGVHREVGIEGEEELVGQGVSYCANCDGRLFAGRDVAYISYAPEGEDEAGLLAEDFGVSVTYLPQYEGEYGLPEGVRVLAEMKPGRLVRRDGKMHVESGGDEVVADAVFIYRETVPPQELLDGVSLEEGHFKVDRHMYTGIPGVFAAGDCTGEPYQIAKAAGEGQMAALQAMRYVRSERESALEEPPALKPEDREALGRILGERMKDPVRLLHFTQKTGGVPEKGLSCDSCREARRLVQEFADLSPLLYVESFDLMDSAARAEEAGVERIPATLIGGVEEDVPRLRMFGLPEGYEFGVLLEAVLGVSEKGEGLAPETRTQLSALEEAVHLEVLVTSTCPYCPGVGKLAHRFARAAEKITADVIVASEFPDVVQRYEVSRVPKVVLNGVPQEPGTVDESGLLAMVLAAAGQEGG